MIKGLYTLYRQFNSDAAANIMPAVYSQSTAMQFNDSLTDAIANTIAMDFGSVIGRKEFCSLLWGQAYTIILKQNLYHVCIFN